MPQALPPLPPPNPLVAAIVAAANQIPTLDAGRNNRTFEQEAARKSYGAGWALFRERAACPTAASCRPRTGSSTRRLSGSPYRFS